MSEWTLTTFHFLKCCMRRSSFGSQWFAALSQNTLCKCSAVPFSFNSAVYLRPDGSTVKKGLKECPGSCATASAVLVTAVLLRSNRFGVGRPVNATLQFLILILSGLNVKEKWIINKESAIHRWPSEVGFLFCVKDTLHLNPPLLRSLKGTSYSIFSLKPRVVRWPLQATQGLEREHRLRLLARWAPLESNCVTDDSPQRPMHNHDKCPRCVADTGDNC